MAERRNQPTDLERATAFLRDSLASHPVTRTLVDSLGRMSIGFRLEFVGARSPREILDAVSKHFNVEQRERITTIVDGWVNKGSQRNISSMREIIARDFETWKASE